VIGGRHEGEPVVAGGQELVGRPVEVDAGGLVDPVDPVVVDGGGLVEPVEGRPVVDVDGGHEDGRPVVDEELVEGRHEGLPVVDGGSEEPVDGRPVVVEDEDVGPIEQEPW